MELKKATRVGIRPLIGMYGESGSGKTMSALLLARGFVGKDGIIGMVDSESGRGSLYADVIPGGYQVLDLTAPFSPVHYIEAINYVEKHATIGVLDSGSHEWEGISGVLDMAAEIESRSGKGLHCWIKPKMEHAKFMLTLLQSPIPWIVCLRAKYKSRQIKNEKGKTEIIKEDFTTPIQADDFLFEMTVHLEITQEKHHARVTKCSHPALLPCFPKDGLIEIKHGELLRQWCDAPTMKAVISERPELVKKLWALTEQHHQGDKKTLEQWLWDEAIISPDGETLANLTEARLKEVVAKVEAKGRAA
jgi:hypothetical protein